MKKRPITIFYPRICDHCNYISNNPPMFHYHKKTHTIIPLDKLCDFGCGLPALFISTMGAFRCNNIATRCPIIKEDTRIRVTADWHNPKSNERKENTKQIFMIHCCNIESIQKMIASKRAKLISQDNTQNRRRYNRQIHRLSQKVYNENKQIINPNDLPLGKLTYHLDHIVSKHVGFLLSIPAHFLANKHNLQVISYQENAIKQFKCSKHPIDLLKECNAPIEVVEEIKHRVTLLGDSFERLLLLRKL